MMPWADLSTEILQREMVADLFMQLMEIMEIFGISFSLVIFIIIASV